MGSAYPTIAADAVARYQRLRGRRVTFLTGTDEHGEKIALAAGARGMAPKAHCDDIVASYKQLWADVSGRAWVDGKLNAVQLAAFLLAVLPATACCSLLPYSAGQATNHLPINQLAARH